MKTVVLALIVLIAALLTLSGSRPPDGGDGCVRCHEMSLSTSDWRASTHHGVDCKTCHGGTLQMANMMKAGEHATGTTPEQIRLKHADVRTMVEQCRACHQQQFADWQGGPHGSKFSKFLVDAKHNRGRLLMDDCLRCHGMHFPGGIRDLVTPIDRRGPWQFKRAELANEPAMPCLTCHSIHTRAKKGAAVRASLALYDRREQQHVLATSLPIPAMLDGERTVKMSPDARQSICFQCHAALANRQVGSGDDRTPKGVHEGLSCLVCHDKHGQSAKASCATCHPRLSNCGLDVEKMDTTFVKKESRHNIHWVRCEDCHGGKRPVRAGAPRL